MWKDDTIRYLGVVGGGSINLTFFGFGDEGTSGDEGFDFNIKVATLIQEPETYSTKNSGYQRIIPEPPMTITLSTATQ